MIIHIDEKLSLRFAKVGEKREIFEMLIASEIQSFMFNETFRSPTWPEFDEDADDTYYTGEASKYGSYLLILYEETVIGSVSYSCEYEKIPFGEIDIWLKSLAYTGKGIGVKVIKALIGFVHETYAIETFLIRPWKKNGHAIKAYEKCGFEVVENFSVSQYYSDKMMSDYGAGDYGEETVNMVLKL